MIFKDYYKILGLETNKVNVEKIKIAYREQAKKYHPDVNGNNTASEERFKDINEAYMILSKPSTRRKYDRMWSLHVGRRKSKSKNVQTEDFFSMFFGEIEKNKDTNLPQKGENIETEIKISIREAYLGTKKTVVLKSPEGKDRSVDINIPAGITEKDKVRIIGQGKPGINGGKNGNLYIKIKFEKDSKFEIKDNDFIGKIELMPWEAVLGNKKEINVMDEKIKILVPAGIQNEEEIVIKEKGYRDISGKRGNLVLKIKINVPKNANSEEIELYKKLREISK